MKYNPFEEARRVKRLNELLKENNLLKDKLSKAESKISQLELMNEGLSVIAKEYENTNRNKR